MPQSLEHNSEYFDEGVSEALYKQEEGNGPPCPGCNKPTKIEGGRFFCVNKARTIDGGFECPLQTAGPETEVTQYISEDAKRAALEAETGNFPNDEAAATPREERDFSFPEEFDPNAGFSEPLESIEAVPEVPTEELQTFEKLGDKQPAAELSTEEESMLSKITEVEGANALTQEINTSDIAKAAEALKSIGVSGFEEIALAGGNEEKTMELLHKLPAESRNTLLWRAGQIHTNPS